MVRKIKEDGSLVAHKFCYPMNVEEVLSFLDQYNEEVKQKKDAFVLAMREFNMVRADGSVDPGNDPLK